MTFESSTSRLSEEQIMNAACNAADALDATRVSEMRPEGWHATTIFDGDAGLIRFGRLVEEAVLARLIPSETESINAAPQGTEGYGLCDDNLGNVPAAAAPFSTDKQDEGRCDICKAEIDEFNAGVEAWRAGVAFHDLPDMPMDQNGVGWVWAAWNGKTFAPSHGGERLTPDWCMDAFWRANPGRNATVPSLYLLDFAREVLRVHGVTPSSSGAHSPTHITALSPELQEHLEKRAAARRQRDGQPEITEAMVEAAAQRMVALVMARIIEKPQLVQWQQWSGSARAILEAALEAAPVTRSATTRREVELEDALRTLLEWAVLSDPKWYGDRKEVRRARSVLRPTESRTKETP
jgi:hypothetical protein